MNFYKKTSIIVSALIVLTSFSGCAAKKVENVSKVESPKVLNISYVKAPLNVPSIIEKKKQLFENEFSKDGISIKYPEITEGSKMTEALAAGSLQFCNAIGATSVILAGANGVDIKIIGIYSRAPKAFTIMVKDPAIKSIKDLKGKKVVGPKGTILHQLLLGAITKENLKADDVQFSNMAIPASVSALLAGKVDAALVAGPSVANAEKNGARILTTGEGILDATIVIAASGKFIEKYPNIVKRYLAVHEKSLQFMKDSKDETYKLTADETKLTLDQVKSMYGLYDFNPKVTQKDISELNKTQDFLKQNGMLTKTVDIKSLIVDLK
ncbi:NrtA/SsuA/CpmA family ABC transporter substrate-binding protein [Clostridium bowmanii]|uniref:ABC transporter substrate-binding protein n=1 Tax=Clostridium bowmanii TaxID=132925 RepID=UPI001C0E49DD|nr:NrtA/SsuA/CpmA family ABC transporter substrate-binding protein [Clostridium bowmanii]MBU3188159.1 NrtA/SsuA/CpmA family ABC transporter substrate-binding protein [Clostridium bowmanii]MCA1072341.1 NrtA/SsuA/CpmA family ABC transporter substrate-binding protein [Clostridium bowmanii]